MVKLSIIAPVYNVGKYLAECFDSILGQTYKNFELLLVDDGSTDNSGAICDEYARLDSRVKVFHKKNGGVSSARNVGLENAVGDWIMFADPDDCYAVDTVFEEIVKCIDGTNADLVNFDYTEFKDGKGGEIFTRYSTPESVETNDFVTLLEHKKFWGCVWNNVYKKDLMRNLRFPIMETSEDMCFNTAVFMRSPIIARIDKRFYKYRLREGSAVGDYDMSNAENIPAFNKTRYSFAFGEFIKTIYFSKKQYPEGVQNALKYIIFVDIQFSHISVDERLKATTDLKTFMRFVKKVQKNDPIRYCYANCYLILGGRLTFFIFDCLVAIRKFFKKLFKK